MRNSGADRPRQAEHGGVDRAEGRSDEMLLTALGDGRLPRQQGAEILEADHVRKDREQLTTRIFEFGGTRDETSL